MNYKIKDRVVLVESKNRTDEGLVVKIFKGKGKAGKSIRTVGVLWDNDWPRGVHFNPKYKQGRVFYYKPNDLKIIGTWRV